MDDYINILKELTEKLPLVPDLEVEEENKNYRKYKVPVGESDAFSLLNIPQIAVAMAQQESGTVIPWHGHEKSIEWLLIYEGCLNVVFEDGTTESLKTGDSLKIEKRQIHSTVCEGKTSILAVTIPSDKLFPKDE